jgi:hypothetical protein
MIARFFYTFSFLLLLPISVLLIFRPEVWQDFYSRFYSSKIEQKGGILKILGKSLLAMSSTEAGNIIHRTIGILLGLLVLYIFYVKLKIVSLF